MTDAERSLPRTQRGRKTRDRLVAAGRVIFERDGFLDTRITDITELADVANGTFYTYFESKEEIFKAVIGEVTESLYAAATVPDDVDPAPQVRIEYATREYVKAYKKHAGLVAILEQTATFNAEFREMRRRIRRASQERIENGIRRLQQQGLAEPDLSARCASEALTSMVSNFCYAWLVLGEEFDEDEAVNTLVAIWMRGIGLKYEPPPGPGALC